MQGLLADPNLTVESAIIHGVIAADKLIKDPGYSEGEICNRDGCQGVIREQEKEGCCSCHVSSPPCSYCTTQTGHCEECGWEAEDA